MPQIGKAVAEHFAAAGARVAVHYNANRAPAERVKASLPGGPHLLIQTNLENPDNARGLIETVVQEAGRLDVLVNNAGLGWYGYGADMPWKTAWEMLQVNVEAVVQLTINFLGRMRRRNIGHIINVGSISGSIPSQGVAVYGATKSFLDSFTTALHRELTGTRVHVSVVRAGPVLTEFGETALSKAARSGWIV